MAYMELKVKTADDRQHVAVELWMDGNPLGHILLGPTAEGHCQAVAKHRADPGARLEAIYDPIWRTTTGHSEKQRGVALILRHPGLGWLSFLLPYKEAEGLGRWLVDHSKPPSSEKAYPSRTS